MENISQIIKRYKKEVTKAKGRPITPCNYRDKNKCPINENCYL